MSHRVRVGWRAWGAASLATRCPSAELACVFDAGWAAVARRIRAGELGGVFVDCTIQATVWPPSAPRMACVPQ
jgi:hypothetical protein